MTSLFSTGEMSTSLFLFDTGIRISWPPALINMNSSFALSVGKASIINSNSSIFNNLDIKSGSFVSFEIEPWTMNPNLQPSQGAIVNFEISPWELTTDDFFTGSGASAFFVTDVNTISYPSTSLFSTSELNSELTAFRMPFSWNMQENFLTFFGKRVIIDGEIEMIFNQEGPLARRSRVQGQVIVS